MSRQRTQIEGAASLFEDEPSTALVSSLGRPAETLVGKTLDRQKIKRPEVELAVAVLAIYCEVAGHTLVGQVWLRKIIMRCREHPELTVEDHRGVIERNFAAPWWRDEPSPSVIYGNDAIFEKAMIVKGIRTGRTQGERKSDRLRKLMSP